MQESHSSLPAAIPGEQPNLPATDENALVERFVEASRELLPSIQVALTKRIYQPGSNRVLCLAAHTTMPLDDEQVASVSDLALRLSDGTSVALSLSFFNEQAGSAIPFPAAMPYPAPARSRFVPFTRTVYNPNYYAERGNDSKLPVVLIATSLITVASLLCAFNLHRDLAGVAKEIAGATTMLARALKDNNRTAIAMSAPLHSAAPVRQIISSSTPGESAQAKGSSNSHRGRSRHHRTLAEFSPFTPSKHGDAQLGLNIPPPPPMARGVLVPPPPPFDPLTSPFVQMAGFGAQSAKAPVKSSGKSDSKASSAKAAIPAAGTSGTALPGASTAAQRTASEKQQNVTPPPAPLVTVSQAPRLPAATQLLMPMAAAARSTQRRAAADNNTASAHEESSEGNEPAVVPESASVNSSGE